MAEVLAACGMWWSCCRVSRAQHSPGDLELANLHSVAALVPHFLAGAKEGLPEGACTDALDLGKQVRQPAAVLVTLISTLAAGHLRPGGAEARRKS